MYSVEKGKTKQILDKFVKYSGLICQAMHTLSQHIMF